MYLCMEGAFKIQRQKKGKFATCQTGHLSDGLGPNLTPSNTQRFTLDILFSKQVTFATIVREISYQKRAFLNLGVHPVTCHTAPYAFAWPSGTGSLHGHCMHLRRAP